MKFRVDGTTVQGVRFQNGYTRGATGNDQGSVYGSTVLDLTAGQYVEVLIDRESSMIEIVTLRGNESLFYMKRL